MQRSLSIILIIAFIMTAGCSSKSQPDATAKSKTAPATLPSPPSGSTQVETPGGQPAISTKTAAPTTGQPSAPPSPPAFPMMGIEMHYIGEQGGLSLVQDSGAYWVRRNALLWANVEPQEGIRDWGAVSSLDEELKNAAESGLEVILIIRRTPDWAQAVPGAYCGAVLPEKIDAFARFIHDAVVRYSASPYNVRYWEIINEPDIDPSYVEPDSVFGCWGNKGDPFNGGGYYAALLKAVYPQIKQANPQAQVLVGGLLLDCDPVNPPETEPGSGQAKDCGASRYLEGILLNGGGDFFDGVSFHAYDFYFGSLGNYINPNWHSAWNVTGPALIAKARYLRSLLAQFGYPTKYLMNTELALLCGRDGSEPACQDETFNLSKAYYLAESYASAVAEGLQANIWYSITGWRASGLLDENMLPTPAYHAFQFTARQLDKAAFIGDVREFSGIKAYEFWRDGKRVWIMWSLDGLDHQVQLSAVPGEIYDVFGAPIPSQQEIVVTLAPVWLEW